MRGLLLKDFYLIRGGWLMMVLMMVIVGVGLTVLSSPWLLLTVAATSLSMSAPTTILNDKVSQWDRFSATLPVSRTQIISSKYTMYVLLGIVGILVGAIASIAVSLLNQSFDVNALLMHSYLAIIISLLPGSVNIPLSYLLDAEKSIVGFMVSGLVTAGAFIVVRFLLSQFIDLEANMLSLFGSVAAFSVAAFLFSWLTCPKIISRKDL